MKNSIKAFWTKSFLFAAVCALSLTACKKDADGSPDYKAGTPAGTITPGEAAGGVVVTLTGSGLGQIRSVVFDKNNVPATFQPNLNTESALVFRVPDTAFGGNQNIIFTNVDGKTLSVPFKVIALPTVSSASAVEFEEGTTITLTGNNLESVSKVTIDGTTDEATVVSKSRKQLVLRMPMTSASRGKLKLVNDSGERITDMEFVSIANNLRLFTEGWDSGFENWSWGLDQFVVTDEAVSGTKALKLAYIGAWGGMQMHRPVPINLTPYSFLSFWVKGDATDRKIKVTVNWAKDNEINVPANKWTYVKIAKQDLNTNQLEKLIFQIMGEPGTFFVDNVLLVK
jgi:hypothetical protein